MTPDFATINGHRLRYRLAGSGPLAIFAHGLLSSMDQLEAHYPGLAEVSADARLLTYDARGHGASDGPTTAGGYTWENLGLDMVGLADFAGEERIIAAGGSMGAATAMWVAIERPERVRALIVVMPPPLGFEEMRGDDERQAIRVLDVLADAVANFGLAKTVEFARQFPGFAPTPEEGEERARWLLKQDPERMVAAIRGVRGAPIHDPECYRQITVPTLVIAHEGDGMHPVRAASLLAGRVAGARLVVAPTPAYWREHPAELATELSAFVAALP